MSSKFTRVRYLRIDRTALEIVDGLSADEKSAFITQVLAWFGALENGEEAQPVETNSKLLNIALRDELSELIEGFENYMQSVNNRKKPSGNDRRCTADIPPSDPLIQSSIKIDSSTNIHSSIKAKLRGEGFRDDEIDQVFSRISDWETIANPEAYVRACIETERKRQKSTVSAQRYEQQRDYQGEQEKAMLEMIKNAGQAV